MIVALSSTLVGVQNQREPDMWKLADTATVRLSPRSFHQLPHKIIRNLQNVVVPFRKSLGIVTRTMS